MDLKSQQKSSRAYYNAIAVNYDDEVEKDFIKELRGIVKSYVVAIPEIKKVLDFGAGTGSDLPWQLDAGYFITFYEPSEKMALVAQKKFNIENLSSVSTIVGDDATYRNLEKELKKIDLIFSNLAAINSIKDIDGLFIIFSRLLKVEGHAVLVLYDPDFKSLLGRLLSVVRRTKKMSISLRNSPNRTDAFMHNTKSLTNAGKKNKLSLIKRMVLGNSGFILYHFKKTA